MLRVSGNNINISVSDVEDFERFKSVVEDIKAAGGITGFGEMEGNIRLNNGEIEILDSKDSPIWLLAKLPKLIENRIKALDIPDVPDEKHHMISRLKSNRDTRVLWLVGIDNMFLPYIDTCNDYMSECYILMFWGLKEDRRKENEGNRVVGAFKASSLYDNKIDEVSDYIHFSRYYLGDYMGASDDATINDLLIVDEDVQDKEYYPKGFTKEIYNLGYLNQLRDDILKSWKSGFYIGDTNEIDEKVIEFLHGLKIHTIFGPEEVRELRAARGEPDIYEE